MVEKVGFFVAKLENESLEKEKRYYHGLPLLI